MSSAAPSGNQPPYAPYARRQKELADNFKKIFSTRKLGFHGGDHAIKAVLELAKVVYGHVVAGGNGGCGLFLDRVFAIGGDGALFQHGAREDVFDGGCVPGESEAHIDNRGGVGSCGFKRVAVNVGSAARAATDGAAMTVDEDAAHYRGEVVPEASLLSPVFAAAQDFDEAHENILHDIVRIGRRDVVAVCNVMSDDRFVNLDELRPFGGIVAVGVFGNLAQKRLWSVGNHGR